MKKLECKDAGFECDAVIVGESEQEIVDKAAAHARKEHDTEVTHEMVDQVRTLIKEEKAAAG